MRVVESGDDRLAAAAARAFGPAYAANELAAVVVPAAAADAVGGWRGVGSSVGSNGGRAAFAAAARGAPPPRTFHRRDGKKEARGDRLARRRWRRFSPREGSWIGEEVPRVDRRARRRTPFARRRWTRWTRRSSRGAAMSPRLRTLADAAVAEAAASAVAAATAAPSTAAFVEATSPAAIAARRAAYDALLSSTLAPRRFVRKIFPSRLRRFAPPRDERTRRWAIARGARC